MSLFLLSFFLVYGSMHAYALLKARSALAFGPGTTLALLLLLGVLLCAPIVTHHLSRHGYEDAARIVARVGYLWMGFLFFFVCLGLSADLLRLALRAMGRAGIAVNATAGLAGRPAFLCIAGLAAALSAYAIVEASRIEIVRVRIVTDRLPASVPSLRIAQITDLHLGLIHRIGKAREVAALVAREHPDLFVSTGDLVDGQLDGVSELAEIFRGIPAPRGKFAALGNHEYYAGIDRAIAFTRRSGFTLLRDESVTVDDAVHIAGVDDPAGARFGRTGGISEAALLGNRPDELFTVLLKHRPQLDPASGGKFDLQLSGHTHHGQIFPFRLLTRLV
ncbi:MAG TPA: metallophosphoesterase, partial [Candidatus Deferrimicrobium sp.]|nr:metallophosphoesterase [Candidatus Deferrimicrobium sp.]